MSAYTIELPTSAFSALRQTPADFIQELKYAAVAKWYELGWVSQSKGAEITGLARSEFLAMLSRYQISILQDTPESITEELRHAE